jgi:Fuc2NAc and GlcNAc transferase
MIHLLIVLGVALQACLITYMLLLYSRRKQVLLDIPNARSSHSAPTPRGGGVGMVVAFVTAVALLQITGVLPLDLSAALTGGGLIIAGIGFLDDRGHLSPFVRLAVHFAAAAWAMYWLAGAPTIQIGTRAWTTGAVTNALCLIGIVWSINLTNFMDGIDGIAGVEAVCVSGLGGLLLLWSGVGGLTTCAFALTGASAGFLVWNWPPAKIFMGDAGSCFLGFVFGVLALASARERPWLLLPWLILLSVFIVDSTVTLTRRLITRARWYEAHCSHAYQHAARQSGSHSKVTSTVAAVNVVWLFPLACGACVCPSFGPLFALVALAPLVYMAFRYDAGQDTTPTKDDYSNTEDSSRYVTI